MIKEDFIKCLKFNNPEEEKEANFYLDMKGIAIHLKIAKHLGLDIVNNNQRIEWKKVSALLRYDKKLREKIYVYLATLEEYIRACISNKYNDNPVQDFWISGKKKRTKIKSRINNGEKVSDVLESIEFYDLVQQVLNLSSADISKMFDNLPELPKNLEAVRELRNAVSHHVFLMEYKFKECIVDGKSNNTLEHNVKNLRQLLPMSYRYGKNGDGGISAEIENCRLEQIEKQGDKKIKIEIDLDSRDIVRLK